jgi:DNA-binding transcriptional MerR regulator
MYSIGQLSRATGVKVPTIRYYEEIGLISNAGRSSGNQRRYDKAGVDALAFVRHARDLGLSIEVIRQLIDMSADPDRPCQEVHSIAVRHLSGIREHIRKLRALERELVRISSKCDGETMKECDVMLSLGNHGLCEGAHR